MATHSSILAWKIAWTEDPGRLRYTGSQSVGDDSVTEHTHLRVLGRSSSAVRGPRSRFCREPARWLWEHTHSRVLGRSSSAVRGPWSRFCREPAGWLWEHALPICASVSSSVKWEP